MAHAITLHAGDPLNQTALLETQRNLYEFALFNEVNTAVENPTGNETRKTVLLQAVEARRWALTYGFGFEAQTGTPQNNCAGASLRAALPAIQGKTGVSPRVLADITRNNLFGARAVGIAPGHLRSAGAEDRPALPDSAFEGNRNLGLTFSGGYANSQDVTTYVASRLEAGIRLTEHFDHPVPSSPKPTPSFMNSTSAASKCRQTAFRSLPAKFRTWPRRCALAGPALTWIRDTRDSALDAHRGTYTSFQEFLSDKVFGAQAAVQSARPLQLQLLRLRQRPLRAGAQHALRPGARFRHPDSQLIPLPERLYAGGPTSLRGFSINAAGPRDPETGYPIGGAGALINSTEMRLPPPTLPFFGDTLSFVLFHDMGNVFTNAGDAWASALRFRQPDREHARSSPPSIQRPRSHPPAPRPRPGSKGRAASTTSRTRPGPGCATTRRLGPSGWTSAIT